ncbi:TPA: hypothetical protein EYG96_01360 [Candidatus Gracilibacteria bacterium]|nr:hypothetical protein [Candidatus Gracilibacteria bacterium]
MNFMNFLKNLIVNIYYFILNTIDIVKQYSVFLIVGFVLLSGSFIIFREFFYFGTLTLHINEENTKIIIDGDFKNLADESFTKCKNNKCEIELYPSIHQIFIQKDGFTTETQTINIELQKNTEIFFQLKPNITTLEDTIFHEFSGVNFPLKKSKISEKVVGFSITNSENSGDKNYLFYKNTPLFPVLDENPIFVSSDEIGRNIFIVSKDKIITFNMQNKTTHLSTQQDITAFSPQSDGTYLIQYNTMRFASVAEFDRDHTPENQAILFETGDQSTNNLQHICITPDDFIIFIAKNNNSTKQREVSIFSSASRNHSIRNPEEKTVLANMSEYDVSHIECITNHKINIFLKDKTAYTVTF